MRLKACILSIIFILFNVGMIIVYNSIPKKCEAYAVENNINIIEETISINDIDDDNIIIDVLYTEDELTYDIIEEPIKMYTDEEVEILTNLLYGEDRGYDKKRQAAVIWCVLNRYDTGKYGDSIISVATAKNQFSGYKKDRVFKDVNAYDRCKEIVIDVLDRYYTEEQIGRVLPKEYLYFVGDGKFNYFSTKWRGKDYWNWSLENPYEK